MSLDIPIWGLHIHHNKRLFVSVFFYPWRQRLAFIIPHDEYACFGKRFEAQAFSSGYNWFTYFRIIELEICLFRLLFLGNTDNLSFCILVYNLFGNLLKIYFVSHGFLFLVDELDVVTI